MNFRDDLENAVQAIFVQRDHFWTSNFSPSLGKKSKIVVVVVVANNETRTSALQAANSTLSDERSQNISPSTHISSPIRSIRGGGCPYFVLRYDFPSSFPPFAA